MKVSGGRYEGDEGENTKGTKSYIFCNTVPCNPMKVSFRVNPEVGGYMFPRNISLLSPDYKESYPRILNKNRCENRKYYMKGIFSS
jgi:hypothetical protein